jgi:hypothetical protein
MKPPERMEEEHVGGQDPHMVVAPIKKRNIIVILITKATVLLKNIKQYFCLYCILTILQRHSSVIVILAVEDGTRQASAPPLPIYFFF